MLNGKKSLSKRHYANKEMKKISLRNIGILDIVKLAIIIFLIWYAFGILNNINNGVAELKEGLSSVISFDNGAEEHDLVLNNNGVFGYLAADFEEAILGKASQKREVVVYTQEVSDATTITKTGLVNWSALTKSQVITYKGTADYFIDLSDFDKTNIFYDEETKTVTIYIPHIKRKDINIREDDIKYSDPEKGLLAFGDLKLTPEQIGAVQSAARTKMEEKLLTDKVSEIADRFAKLTIWEIYSPVVKGVGKDVSLIVEFDNVQ